MSEQDYLSCFGRAAATVYNVARSGAHDLPIMTDAEAHAVGLAAVEAFGRVLASPEAERRLRETATQIASEHRRYRDGRNR